MATSSNAKSNTPLIAAIAVLAIGALLYFLTRGLNIGGNQAGEPVTPPQGKAAKWALNTGSLIKLGTSRVTRLPANNELGTGRTGWVAEIAYIWKDELDGKLTFKAPFRLIDGPGSYAIPAKGTPGATPVPPASAGPGPARSAVSPATTQKKESGARAAATKAGDARAGDAKAGDAKAGNAKADATGEAVAPVVSTFLLPRRTGKVRLLLPSTPVLQLKKGQKVKIALQVEMNNWQIPASNEITLPPLP